MAESFNFDSFKPAQMYDHELNPVKGWPGEWAVDKNVDFDPSVEDEKIKAGRVAHIDPVTRKFKMGLGTYTGTNCPVPFFLFQNGRDFDVVGDHGNLIGATWPATRHRNVMGLAATGGYELETTGYVAEGTYNPGDLLSANADGELTVIDAAGDLPVCGVVSDGKVPHDHKPGSYLLRFHTAFFVRYAS